MSAQAPTSTRPSRFADVRRSVLEAIERQPEIAPFLGRVLHLTREQVDELLADESWDYRTAWVAARVASDFVQTGPTSYVPRVERRPGWDEYFMGIAEAVATRADCTRRKVGAVLVDDQHRIVGTGYNGAPSGVTGCLDGGCPRGKLTTQELAPMTDYDAGPGRCVALHAEVNAVLYAVRAARGTTCYVNHEPCGPCLRTLAGAGVARVVWPTGECNPVAAHAARTGA